MSLIEEIRLVGEPGRYSEGKEVLLFRVGRFCYAVKGKPSSPQGSEECNLMSSVPQIGRTNSRTAPQRFVPLWLSLDRTQG